MVPSIARAVVVQVDPDNYAVFVSLLGALGGQGPTLPVQVGTQGPRDAVRGSYPALPLPGTHGIVAFTSGDYRNGVWICSTRTQLQDAGGHAPGKAGEDHAAYHGGGWFRRGQDGSYAEVWPDGTSFALGASGAVPTRHTLDGAQARVRTPYVAGQRTPSPPAAFPLAFTHPSGASLSLSAAGAWAIEAAPGQTVTTGVAGGTNVVVNADGSVTVTSPAAVTIAASSSVTINAGTAVTIAAPAVSLGAGATRFVQLAGGFISTMVKAL